MLTTRMVLVTAALVLAGCYEGVSGPGDLDELPGRVPGADGEGEDPSDDDDGPDSGEPGHHDQGEIEDPAGRRVRRMTAQQFHRSLIAVTGQPWPAFDDYAAAMGKADFAEITDEGREISVTFDKFVHDAALHSCTAAIDADLEGTSAGTVMRWTKPTDRDEVVIRRNLDYLMLRFLGQETKPTDPRVDPWMNLLTHEPSDGEIDDGLMIERWTAVCVGLVTHPDFVTY
ncbi:hypothetical protein [Paraliomyxa miuraensis]|uniref:hypothetical protein n=1 Tax=Paraliomyxa miuraensis TaxID=376150 RepID=UPI00224DE270|nr:hypothetical protein [Paraliomyxa miuraensis]MCX4239199.1 hypothetical protein [Paraliomyxa miuraensis]